eukprot:SAG11_NODE_669_length_7835_cov_20.412229_2_plen_48_part_00
MEANKGAHVCGSKLAVQEMLKRIAEVKLGSLRMFDRLGVKLSKCNTA